MRRFLEKFLSMPNGYTKGRYRGRTYGVTVEISADGHRRKLFAEELGGGDHVSFNLYLLDGKPPQLKPCEMPTQKVIDFVEGFSADA
ncbi:MAG: hypothetical protein AAFX08_06665 [Pseudomonadota bacterium]